MARIHRAAFRADRAWSQAEFAQLLTGFGVRSFALEDGFALGRQVLDESELLTIAVHPVAQGRGIGHRLVNLWLADASQGGATRAFLEVAADNHPARQLYAAHGFRETGRRAGYYGRDGDASVDALLMSRALPDGAGPESPVRASKTG
ncbi:GNAT family N-acetyltransferase [Sulfitobacter sp. D35]|uniref:GNAT family N-acetyltransferase n=1 Tax=Sulfitobacter sp. D35 TaxID=3083252 RepID=UPI00296F7133|nr:GNAT family N-acetyltransferase [Sulfitobacter sp. D35]MDW4499096.1 GNAT family N-acetyltransferase [Sulfitobacter sp. D35]